MKTTMHSITTICAVALCLNSMAQRDSQNQNSNQQASNQQQNQQQNSTQQQTTQSGDRHRNHHGNGNWGWNNGGGGVTVTIGNGGYWNTNYGNGYGNNYGYNNYYSVKKAARQSLRQTANVIGQALQFSDWNDTYSPWLAKAIRHQQYAKQLYFWGDYAGALNHAERAGYLAWNTLTYFNGMNGYDDFGDGNNYPNPYQDPNNPYYRKGNTPTTNQQGNNQNNQNTDEDFGYKKQQTTTDGSQPNENKPLEKTTEGAQRIQKNEVDTKLPQSTISDKELLKINAKDLQVE